MLKSIYRKGEAMLISAISANIVTPNTKIYPCAKVSMKLENSADTSFNSTQPNLKKIQDKKLNEIYDSINEWKNFCHEQILGGKLDIIA